MKHTCASLFETLLHGRYIVSALLECRNIAPLEHDECLTVTNLYRNLAIISSGLLNIYVWLSIWGLNFGHLNFHIYKIPLNIFFCAAASEAWHSVPCFLNSYDKLNRYLSEFLALCFESAQALYIVTHRIPELARKCFRITQNVSSSVSDAQRSLMRSVGKSAPVTFRSAK